MAKRRLTARQQAFVDAYLAGNPPSEAYKSAYNTSGMSAATIATEAQRVLSNPNVSPIISKSKRQAIERSSWNRELAIERMKSVNDRAFDELIAGDLSRDAQRAFFDSEQRLGELCDFGFEQEIRRRGVNNEIANSSEFAVIAKPGWEQMRKIMMKADERACEGRRA